MKDLGNYLNLAKGDDQVRPIHINPSMGELLDETDAIYKRCSDNNSLVEKISNVSEQLEVIAAVAQESGQLSDLSRSFISRAYKGITGLDVMGGRLLALEDEEAADDEFKNEMVEDVQEKTLDKFLISLKNQFFSNWGDSKVWYGKVVGLRETVIRKNKDIADRAVKVAGDPKLAEFTFKENIDVDNNGKVSYQELIMGLESLVEFSERRLTAKVDKDFEDFIVGVQRVVDGYKTSGEADSSELLKYKNLYVQPPEIITEQLEPAEVLKLSDSKDVKLAKTKNFPGMVYVVTSAPDTDKSLTPYSFIDDTWIKLIPLDSEPKESVHVKTFYPNQILNISSSLTDLLDSVSWFDKSWERRDRFMTKAFASLDKSINVISSKLSDSTKDKQTDMELRGLIRVMIKSIQLDNTFNSMLINHVIKVAAQIIELNNACLLQYKDE